MDFCIFMWNCQGLGSDDTVTVQQDFSQQYKAALLILVEPRVNGRTADKVIRRIGFPFSFRGILRGHLDSVEACCHCLDSFFLLSGDKYESWVWECDSLYSFCDICRPLCFAFLILVARTYWFWHFSHRTLVSYWWFQCIFVFAWETGRVSQRKQALPIIPTMCQYMRPSGLGISRPYVYLAARYCSGTYWQSP